MACSADAGKMMTSWFKEFKEGISTAKYFIEERKKGQHTDEENTYLSFIDHVINHEGDVMLHLDGQIRQTISDKANVKLMEKGLCVKYGKGRVPGEFWVAGVSTITVPGTNQAHTIDLGDLIAFVSDQVDQSVSKLKKPSDVSCYIMSSFSKSIVAFITQNPDLLSAADRKSICTNTHPSDMSAPYSGQKGEQIRNFVRQGLKYPLAQTLLKTHGGESFPAIINGVVDDFNIANVAILQQAANEAFMTGDLTPIVDATKSLAGKAAHHVSSKSKKHCCEQE